MEFRNWLHATISSITGVINILFLMHFFSLKTWFDSICKPCIIWFWQGHFTLLHRGEDQEIHSGQYQKILLRIQDLRIILLDIHSALKNTSIIMLSHTAKPRTRPWSEVAALWPTHSSIFIQCDVKALIHCNQSYTSATHLLSWENRPKHCTNKESSALVKPTTSSPFYAPATSACDTQAS